MQVFHYFKLYDRNFKIWKLTLIILKKNFFIFDVSMSIAKHKIKDEITKSSIPLGIKPKPIYNEVSHEMRFTCPEYNEIKSKIKISNYLLM